MGRKELISSVILICFFHCSLIANLWNSLLLLLKFLMCLFPFYNFLAWGRQFNIGGGICPPLSRPCLCFTHFCHICTLIFYLPSIKSTIFHAKKSFHNDQLCIFYTRMEHWWGGGASQVGAMVAKRGAWPPTPALLSYCIRLGRCL